MKSKAAARTAEVLALWPPHTFLLPSNLSLSTSIMTQDESAGPLLPRGQGPRVILYHQTYHPDNGAYVSLLPLITNNTGITHIIIAAVHLNEGPGNIALNDDPPDHQKYTTLWSELQWLQASGVKILALLGGAAKGSFARLDGDDPQRFEAYYTPLRDTIRRHNLQGLDLDVEEAMSLPGIIRLIDRLRADFGPDFLITLAPVATALLPGSPHLSGFDYSLLEQMRGREIAWYNAQFYCGWGDAGSTYWYDAIMSVGWDPSKVVMGLITNPRLGAGHVAMERIEGVLRSLRQKYPGFGGVMGWEYFSALPGGRQRPWEWAMCMERILRTPMPSPGVPPQVPGPGPGQGQAAQVPIRPYAGNAAPSIPPAPQPFPAESVKTLQDLGFGQQQAIAALNMTNGNVEQAAGLLFDD